MSTQSKTIHTNYSFLRKFENVMLKIKVEEPAYSISWNQLQKKLSWVRIWDRC